MPPILHKYDKVIELYSRAAAARPQVVREVMALRPADFELDPLKERGLPSAEKFKKSGWWHYMLSRYFFSAAAFCKNRQVLELCSGLGWGARILAEYAASVTCLELDADALERARKVWRARENINWRCGDALRAGEFFKEPFDVVVTMEAIEHFPAEGGRRLIEQACGLLGPGGTFVASSYYPDSRLQAERALLEAGNPYHLHLFTKSELGGLCDGLFSEAHLYGDYLLVARK